MDQATALSIFQELVAAGHDVTLQAVRPGRFPPPVDSGGDVATQPLDPEAVEVEYQLQVTDPTGEGISVEVLSAVKDRGLTLKTSDAVIG